MTPLERLVRERIGRSGPFGVEPLMNLALHHPEHGYYVTRDPLGASGDFVTSPEISQIFGELIGAWIAVTWEQAGRPSPVALVEAGPGRGTLMSDACRAIGGGSDMLEHAEIHLVESSPLLRGVQRRTLSRLSPRWHDRIADLPEDPMILVGNEYLDCHPPLQLVRVSGGWAERRVAVEGDRLALVPGEVRPTFADLVPDELREAPPGTVFEVHRTLEADMTELGARLGRRPGAVLFVDYGHDRPAAGDTLQAVHGHRHVDPLTGLGECDITVHVDFSAVARGLRTGRTEVHGPVPQRRFLRELGIDVRADRLARAAGSREEEEAVRAAADRLIDPAGMGTLFKVVAATAAGMPVPPGFGAGLGRC